MFILRECLRSIRRSPVSMVLIALVIGVGVGLTAVFAYVAFSARESLAEIERSIAIDVYFDQSMTNDDAKVIFEQQISNRADIAEARFITKEDALQEYETGTGQDVRAVLGDNPLPAGATVKIKEPSSDRLEKKIAEVRSIAGVSEVLADQELVKNLSKRSTMLSTLTAWLGALMALVILIVVIVATRLTVEIRKQTLTVMRMLGASRWKVNGPFILEGLTAGFIGGIVASIVLLGLDELALRTLLPATVKVLPAHADLLATALLLGIGVGLGLLGSILALVLGNKRV